MNDLEDDFDEIISNLPSQTVDDDAEEFNQAFGLSDNVNYYYDGVEGGIQRDSEIINLEVHKGLSAHRSHVQKLFRFSFVFTINLAD